MRETISDRTLSDAADAVHPHTLLLVLLENYILKTPIRSSMTPATAAKTIKYLSLGKLFPRPTTAFRI